MSWRLRGAGIADGADVFVWSSPSCFVLRHHVYLRPHQVMFFSWHGSAPPPPLSRRARPCLRAYSASFAGARVSEQSAARVMFARDGVFADGGEVEYGADLGGGVCRARAHWSSAAVVGHVR